MSAVYVLTADNHLGKGAHLYSERLDEQEAVWRKTLALARALDADGVLHGGDLFDRRRPSPAELVAAERPLVDHRAAGGCEVHVVPGNHDPTAFGPGGLDVLGEAGLITLHHRPRTVNLPGIVLCALPWVPPGRVIATLAARDGADESVAALLTRVAGDLFRQSADEVRVAETPRVLLGHWSLAGARLPNGLPVEQLREPVLDPAELEAFGYAAVVFGHIHVAGPVSSRSLYTGTPMPLDHGDSQLVHGVWSLHVGAPPTGLDAPLDELAPGVWLDAHPLESRRFVTITLADVERYPVDGAVVRVKDTLTTTAHDRSGLDDVAAARETLLERGARRVDFAVTVERERRPITTAVDTDGEPRTLLAEYLDVKLGSDLDLVERLVELAEPYLAGERQPVNTGGGS